MTKAYQTPMSTASTYRIRRLTIRRQYPLWNPTAHSLTVTIETAALQTEWERRTASETAVRDEQTPILFKRRKSTWINSSVSFNQDTITPILAMPLLLTSSAIQEIQLPKVYLIIFLSQQTKKWAKYTSSNIVAQQPMPKTSSLLVTIVQKMATWNVKKSDRCVSNNLIQIANCPTANRASMRLKRYITWRLPPPITTESQLIRRLAPVVSNWTKTT